ncbi:MAG: hypothetical protein MUE85_19605 [Microscillaceae bacterium]|jgi:hypothetical protein|nr:hypothetical protein [Microscillaceae bacterium]
MLKRTLKILGLFTLGFTLTMCGGGNSQNTEKKEQKSENKAEGKTPEEKSKPSQDDRVDRKFNDIARFIGGLPAEEGSALAKFHDEPAWKDYAKTLDNQWKSGNQAKVDKMATWAKEALQAPNAQNGTLFYPFGGADFLHAALFFPEAKETVMMGLEPIGNMPDFEKIKQKGSMNLYFGAVRRSLVTILQYSFFKTNDMAVDFTGRIQYDLDGTLPIILFFMTRTNHKILFFERVAINAEGKLVNPEEVKAQGKEPVYYGNRIAYQRADKPEERKYFYYFSVNLGNDPYDGRGGLTQRKDLVKYIENLDVNATYLKSASYLMYKPYFYQIRDLILKKSKYLLQDDSGMPLRNFLPGKDNSNKYQWDLTFFGAYAGPIALFGNYWQNDMKQAYQKKEQVKPLPFGIGYQFREGTSNLMLAVKK